MLVILREPIITCDFPGEGGSVPPVPPSGSMHVLLVGSLYCKQYGPRSDCSLRTILIRVHSVCFYDKI